MNEMQDFNSKVIEEFRSHAGVVGGAFDGTPLLLLTTTGARSGQPRVNPLAYLSEGDRIFVFASKAGAPTHPDWFHNLRAHPTVTVERGSERYQATATVLDGEERDRVYSGQAAANPGFAEYQAKTERVIPVVELIRT
jgi:deazaflavin-dependent oxidoreductase (nitroreductase family)